MGIDAKIVLKVKGPKPTEDWLARKSFELCTAIGADKFFLTDGLPCREYEPASAAWHAAFKAHPKYADRSAWSEIRAQIGPAPEKLRRAINLTCYDYDGEERGGVEPGKVYLQDGDDVFADPGEWMLSISVWSRYYGVGYERGDLLTLCAIAEWCEHNIRGCRVFYGGDSSGVCIEPFDASRRDALKAHLWGKCGRDYYEHEKRGTFPTPKPCGLCIPGEPRFNRHGWGGCGATELVAVNCTGCGKSWRSSDAGATWTEEKDGE